QIATTEFAYYQGGEPALTGDHATVRTAILRKMDTDALSSAYRELALERAASFLSEAKQIVISRGVRSLDPTLFSRSAKLERFTLDDNDLFSLESGALIRDGMCIAYPGASSERKVVLTQIDAIAEGAFRYAQNIEELTLPFVGQSRGSSFAHMGLFGYIFGRSSAGILQQAGLSFAIPTSLRVVTITDETSIAPYAFAGCDFLQEIRLNEGIVAIGDYAFDRCHALETLEIPSTVVWMEMSEDYSCSRLSGIVCPEGLTLAYAERNFFAYHENGKIIYQR
ncbi:MAG: leucine-rich repeat domain-containing protein, partial [Christensenellaceae bacterium]